MFSIRKMNGKTAIEMNGPAQAAGPFIVYGPRDVEKNSPTLQITGEMLKLHCPNAFRFSHTRFQPISLLSRQGPFPNSAVF